MVNECFAPTGEEVSWAKRVVDASAAVHGGATSVDGQMVDRPVLARAEKILEMVAQLKQR